MSAAHRTHVLDIYGTHLHAALAIHKHAGATPDGEPLAYLTGWLTAWLWTRLP